MSESELKELITKNPESLIAQAYRLGLKTKALELSPLIEKLIKDSL